MREKFYQLARDYFHSHKAKRPSPGEDYISVSGKRLEEDDLIALIDASLDMWLTSGRFSQKFEKDFAAFCQQKFCLLVNSGSSANLVALAALTSPRLKERQIGPGDEVITVAAGFPTTVNPIFQLGATPVFVDVELETYDADPSSIEAAISDKTKAVMMAHTLGNAFDVKAVKEICDKHGLWLIEDCCDALGTKVDGKMVGTFGDMATVSFYPAHHMTMGEGGAVLTQGPLLKKLAESFRDWGRDCWCPPGQDDTCGKRFDWNLGDLPPGYDHKYIYSHIGYNLKVTDMQAAIGVSQLNKVEEYISIRKKNFNFLFNHLAPLQDFFHLPRSRPGVEASWFGFPLTLKDSASFSRRDFTQYLESKKIATRNIFGGNLLKQPLYKGQQYRVVGELKNSDKVMEDSLWLGVHQSLDEEHMDYIGHTIKEFVT